MTLDERRDTMREGRIVQMRDAQLTLHDMQQRVEWKLPYPAIEPPEPGRATAATNTASAANACCSPETLVR